MNARSVFVLMVAVVSLAGFIFLVERPAGDSLERAEKARRAFRMIPERVREVEVDRGDLSLRCIQEDEENWRMQRPDPVAADASAIKRLLAGLESLTKQAVITAGEMTSRGVRWADYGLDPPAAVIRLAGQGPVWQLDVGGVSPTGDGVYVRVAGMDAVLRVETNLLTWIPVHSSDWRDRRVFQMRMPDVERLEFRRPGGDIRLVRTKTSEWNLLQPVGSRGDRIFVEGLLQSVLDMQVVDFIQDSGGVTAYGFEEANLEIELEGKHRSPSVQTLRIGRNPSESPDRVYASLSHQPYVFTVSTQVVSQLLTPVLSFRDRRLTSLATEDISSVRVRWGDRKLEFIKESDTWRMLAPLVTAADKERVEMLITAWIGARVEEFVDPPFSAPLDVGWDQPQGDIFLGNSPNSTIGVQIAIHSTSPSEGRILARIEADGSLYILSNGLADTLTLDPMLFRDLTVLQLKEEDLQSLSIAWSDRRIQATQSTNGIWTAEEGTLDPKALKQLLKVLQEVRATAWIRHAPSDLAVFGLEEPIAKLTIQRAGTDGCVQTLLLGRDSGSGRYAMIQGRDDVFLLSSGICKILLIPFVVLETPKPALGI